MAYSHLEHQSFDSRDRRNQINQPVHLCVCYRQVGQEFKNIAKSFKSPETNRISEASVEGVPIV
jgi:hypothetical protein